MDELTLLRSVLDDQTPTDPHTIARGRLALLEHIEGATAPRRAPRTPRRRWVTGGSIVAAGVAAAILAGTGGGEAPTAAAAVLDDAAVATIKTSDPAVAAGHYLEVATTGVYAAGNLQPDGAMVTYLSSADAQLYIPADPHDPWVWVRDEEKPVTTFGPASVRAAKADAASHSPGEYLRAADGAFYGDPVSPSPAELAALPRDPAELLDRIHQLTAGESMSQSGHTLAWIADALRTGLAPADLRAALYRAAALIPGIEVVDREATLDGQTGVAVGYAEQGGERQDIIIDPVTGLLIGERQVVSGSAADYWAVPDGTATEWTAITTTVVDAAPTHGPR